jgi:hypothetical protein
MGDSLGNSVIVGVNICEDLNLEKEQDNIPVYENFPKSSLVRSYNPQENELIDKSDSQQMSTNAEDLLSFLHADVSSESTISLQHSHVEEQIVSGAETTNRSNDDIKLPATANIIPHDGGSGADEHDQIVCGAETNGGKGEELGQKEDCRVVRDTKDLLPRRGSKRGKAVGVIEELGTRVEVLVLEELETYGDFEVHLITKNTSKSERKDLADWFSVDQKTSWVASFDEEKACCTTKKKQPWQRPSNNQLLYRMLFSSSTHNITSSFVQQESDLQAELRQHKKQKTNLITVFLPDHFQDCDDSPELDETTTRMSRSSAEKLTFDVYYRLQPLQWLSNVTIDAYLKKILKLHDHFFETKGETPPKVTILTSSVFTQNTIDESNADTTTKKQKYQRSNSHTTRGQQGNAANRTETLVCYDNARWFGGPKAIDQPLRFREGQDRIYIPFNRRDNHWALMYLHGPGKIIYYMDPLWSDGSPILRTLLFFLSKMASQAKDCEDLASWLRDFDPTEWTLVDLGGDGSVVPQQGNGCDCGVFVCMFMTYLICMPQPFLIIHDDETNNKNVQYTFQRSVEGFRRKMQRFLFDKTIDRVTTFQDFLVNC